MNYAQVKSFEEYLSRSEEGGQESTVMDFFDSAHWFGNLVNTTSEAGSETIMLSVGDSPGLKRISGFLATQWNPSKGGYFARRFLHGLTTIYSVKYRLVLLDSKISPQESARLIAEHLYASYPRWEAIRLDCIPVEENNFQTLETAFRHAGFLVQPFSHFGNWYENVETDSFDSYLNRRPARLRNTLERKLRKISRVGKWTLQVFPFDGDLEAGIACYAEVYQRSWKNEEPHFGFVPGLARAAAESGALRLGVLYMAGVPVAVQIWLLSNGCATIFKLAYSEDYKDFSVGSVLTAEMVKRLLTRDRIRELDFGRGDETYKRDWMSSRRERWGFLAFHPRTFRGLIGATRHVGAYHLKRIGRSLPFRARDV